MSGRTIAIGDIHGCRVALETLLNAVAPSSDDCLITLGDYVDRGPDSRGVIQCLLELRGRCRLIHLQGNHEWMMLNAMADQNTLPHWLLCGGTETLVSYGGDLRNVPPEHTEFLEECRDFWETESHFFVHANYDPATPVADLPPYTRLWRHLTELPGPHHSGKTAVVGHTPQVEGDILRAPGLLCIDTFCFGGGWLTAYDVENQVAWQADQAGHLRTS